MHFAFNVFYILTIHFCICIRNIRNNLFSVVNRSCLMFQWIIFSALQFEPVFQKNFTLRNSVPLGKYSPTVYSLCNFCHAELLTSEKKVQGRFRMRVMSDISTRHKTQPNTMMIRSHIFFWPPQFPPSQSPDSQRYIEHFNAEKKNAERPELRFLPVHALGALIIRRPYFGSHRKSSPGCKSSSRTLSLPYMSWLTE